MKVSVDMRTVYRIFGVRIWYDTAMTEDKRQNGPERIADREKNILRFWRENDIFGKSAGGAAEGFFRKWYRRIFGAKEFVFYDGPPFATGLPHYGHILQSVLKDAVLRHMTMRGYRMNRRWGWDCHGLPLEVEIEKEIGTGTKKDIEEYGVERFNRKAREAMLRYADEWKKIIPRVGRWVDMENDYRTVNTSYTESVWSVFHRLYRKGFVSEGFKTLHLCPRCSTTISNHEVADAYETLTDTAVYALFPLKEDPDTLFVAWTTTPWTLPGNVALAVHEDLMYAVVEKDGKRYILHENAAEHVPGGVVRERRKGSAVIGTEYLPLFDSLHSGTGPEESEKLWRVYHAPYVDERTGTGIVHLAPAYGAEDLTLARRYGLPVRHHVSKDGVFVPETGEFAGLRPKDAGNPGEADGKIIDALSRRGLLLKKERIAHSYPVCWRCSTPLLNYATNSWFVHTERYREKMVAENRNVRWVPEHLRDGRFGRWIAGAREWAVSRSRFWGAPLPVWRVEKTGGHLVIDSVKTMLGHMRRRNRYFFVRHGESESNVREVFACTAGGGLTDTGRRQADAAGERLRGEEKRYVFCSPLARARESADRIAGVIGASVREDPLLSEIQVPELDGKPIAEFFAAAERCGAAADTRRAVRGGESYHEVYLRLLAFLKKTEEEYSDAVIIVVTHGAVVRCALSIAPTFSEFNGLFLRGGIVPNGSVHPVSYRHLERTADGEVDLHRPYIDGVVLYDAEGNPAYHCGEVFDCWFESGSMPCAAWHYPFENRTVCDPERGRGFPADCVCEAMDQTRGWFYSLMAISVGAFGKAPYRRVIATGLIRAADGKKMSKKLKNYADPVDIVERYGADPLRHYLLASPVVRGEDIDFQDGQVDEVRRKVYTRLENCFAFYRTYAHLPHRTGGGNPLDRYIIARLRQMHGTMTDGFSSYRLDIATAPIAGFVEDLSAWYVRRSRDRIRSDTAAGEYARGTLRDVLVACAKYIAPIAPFCAEHLFMNLRACSPGKDTLPESVHLCEWGKKRSPDLKVIRRTDLLRGIVSDAHEQRVTAGVKVRQPLGKMSVRIETDAGERRILMDEINVKEVVTDTSLDRSVLLDTALTPALRKEGFVREYIRNLQQMRKEAGYSLTETLRAVRVCAARKEEDILRQFEEKICSDVRAEGVEYLSEEAEGMRTVSADGAVVSVSLVGKEGRE